MFAIPKGGGGGGTKFSRRGESPAPPSPPLNETLVVPCQFCLLPPTDLVIVVGVAVLVWWDQGKKIAQAVEQEVEIRVRRKKGVQSSESAEWLNVLLNRWCVCVYVCVYVCMSICLYTCECLSACNLTYRHTLTHTDI